jgi:hypothetical protein
VFLKRRRRAAAVAAASALGALSLWTAGPASADLYYVSLDFPNYYIAKANDTGQTTDSSFIPVGRMIGPCCTHIASGFGVATTGRHMYWSNADSDQYNSSSIGRATIGDDGEVVAGSVTQTLAPVPDIAYGLALAMRPDGGAYLYYAHQIGFGQPGSDGIGRIELDPAGDVVPGSVDPDFITGADDPYHVAAAGNDIYWGNQGTDSIGHARIDAEGAIIGAPDHLMLPSGDVPSDPDHEPDVWSPMGVAVGGGNLYWANHEWKYPGAPRGGGHQIGRVALGADGLASGPVENKWVTGVGSVDRQFTGATSPNSVATDGAYVYWANGGLPFWSDKDDDIGRAPVVDPMGPNFSYSWVRTEFNGQILALRGAEVGADCPTSKEPVVTCTVTVSNRESLGAAIPQGRVIFSATGSGSFDPADGECLLSPASDSTATCVIDYAREGDGGELITARYTGGPTFAAAEGDAVLLPVPKDPPADDGTPVLPVLPDPLPRPQTPGKSAKPKCKKAKSKKQKRKSKKKCSKGKRKKKR